MTTQPLPPDLSVTIMTDERTEQELNIPSIASAAVIQQCLQAVRKAKSSLAFIVEKEQAPALIKFVHELLLTAEPRLRPSLCSDWRPHYFNGPQHFIIQMRWYASQHPLKTQPDQK